MSRSKPSFVLLSLLAMLAAGVGQVPVAAASEPAADATTAAADEGAAGESTDDANTGDESGDESPDGEAPDGAAPDGGATDGEAPDGEVTDGEATDETDGGASDGEAPDGEATDAGAPETDAGTTATAQGDAADGEDAEATTAAAAAQPPEDGFPLRSAVSRIGNPTPDIVLSGSGWGHGVGMSQYGAYNMAKNGHDEAGILNHYYAGTQVSTDARADERIRVNIHAGLSGASGASLEAIDGPVEWRACQPRAGTTESIDHRVSDCILDDPADPEDPDRLHEQAAGTTLRVCFWDGEEAAPENPDEPEPTPSPSPSPTLPPPPTDVEGLKLITGNDCNDLDAIVATTDRPVLRAYHHGTMIRSRVNATATGRRYQHGWQDFHRKPLAMDVVQDIDTVERYLEGLAESIRSWGVNGPAALRAQAITGRTYALRAKGSPRGLRAGTRACSCDLLNTPADQVYAGRDFALAQYGDLWVDAVEATHHEVLRYDGNLAQTYYSSSHGGGRSEAIHESWAYGNTAIPYLKSVEDPYSINEPTNTTFKNWTSNATHAAFAAHVSSGRPEPLVRVERVQILNRTQGGTPREIQVTGVTADGDTDSFVFTHRTNDSATLREKQIAGASFRVNLPTSGHPAAAGSRLPSSQIRRIGFGPFTDDDGISHEYSITWASLAGVAEGKTETTFDPGGDVTRAQMASFIFRTFEIPEPTIRGGFDDVTDDNVHARAIDALAEAGVAGGYGDGTFRPGENVTREQMATFIARAAGLSTDEPEEDPFADVPAATTHGGAVASVAEAGITQGCAAGENLFCPRDPVSRQQMASFLRRTATS